jgi:ABC-type transport system substrate-binding protein
MQSLIGRIGLALVAGAVIAAGCTTAGAPAASLTPVPTPGATVGQASSGPAATSNPATTAAPTAGRSPGGSPTDGAITFADNGATLALHIGDRFLLNLGSDFDWTVSVDDPSVVERVRNVTVVRGAQGVYEALKTGTTMLHATGDPPCRKATPACGAPSILFEVTLVVA